MPRPSARLARHPACRTLPRRGSSHHRREGSRAIADQPAAARTLRSQAGGALAAERINHQLLGPGQKADQEVSDRRGHDRSVRDHAEPLGVAARLGGIGAAVPTHQHVLGDAPFRLPAKGARQAAVRTIRMVDLHLGAAGGHEHPVRLGVRLQHTAIVCERVVRCIAQPDQGLVTHVQVDALFGSPGNRPRRLAQVHPRQAIHEVQAVVIFQRHDDALDVRGARGAPRIEYVVAEIQHQGSAVRERPHDGLDRTHDEIDVLREGHVAVGALPAERIRRRRQHQVDRFIQPRDDVHVVAPDGDTESRRERDQAHRHRRHVQPDAGLLHQFPDATCVFHTTDHTHMLQGLGVPADRALDAAVELASVPDRGLCPPRGIADPRALGHLLV